MWNCCQFAMWTQFLTTVSLQCGRSSLQLSVCNVDTVPYNSQFAMWTQFLTTVSLQMWTQFLTTVSLQCGRSSLQLTAIAFITRYPFIKYISQRTFTLEMISL
ncbi:hypothetical protein CHS0354_014010 [Potamilus streckersoni]|uniref:Secreted protein n=1 Tax=Potamilus streckersoni TaxID=2493646 RepID=A0AAE0TKA4_9BIVA|nr:hypothetical protein CHS0354_014010 [Potamilus streckersoni]